MGAMNLHAKNIPKCVSMLSANDLDLFMNYCNTLTISIPYRYIRCLADPPCSKFSLLWVIDTKARQPWDVTICHIITPEHSWLIVFI